MRKHAMTGWYDPIQLLRTGVDVLVSSILSARGDFRQIEALATPQEVFRYDEHGELWLDYVADVGDGWDSTFAVASLLGRPALTLGQKETPQGRLLIMGGDEVYPVGNRQRYEEKLIDPYTAAMTPGAREPDLFAIPGNHDWYDGLTAFMRLFCQQRTLGAWRTRQARSYFALQLPHHWWLLAVDIQLQADIDRPQRDYFLQIADQMQPGDRIILCTAEPDWVHAATQEDPQLQRTVAWMLERIEQKTGAEVRVRLAGDLHHYRRHLRDDGRVHNIICGGGGAFMHPTHGPSVDEITCGTRKNPRRYTLQTSFPERRASWWLTFRNLLFSVTNPKFAFLIAGIYLMLSWLMPPVPVPKHMGPFGPWLFTHAWTGFSDRPSALALAVIVVGGFIAFTETHKPFYRWVGGGTHALAHLGAALGCTLAANIATHQLRNPYLHSLATILIKYGLGFFVGSTLFGLYLLVSLNLFQRHSNEAFSSLRIPDWKCFLRLHIDAEGALTIYPIGVRRVPRDWADVPRPAPGAPTCQPAQGAHIPYDLIEPPIRLN